MPLDATVGSSTANSYVTVAEADLYFDNRAHASDWHEVSDKDKLLMTASQQIDWYLKFKGDKADYSQSMKWPRIGILYPDETEYPDDIIPPEVKVAVYEMALSSIGGDRSSDQDLDGLAEVRASTLMIRTDSGVRTKQFSPIPNKIKTLLSSFILNEGMGVVRLSRA